MKKLALLIVVILSMTGSQLSAQNVAVKTNFLYWATTTPNIGAEVSIDRKNTKCFSDSTPGNNPVATSRPYVIGR